MLGAMPHRVKGSEPLKFRPKSYAFRLGKNEAG